MTSGINGITLMQSLSEMCCGVQSEVNRINVYQERCNPIAGINVHVCNTTDHYKLYITLYCNFTFVYVQFSCQNTVVKQFRFRHKNHFIKGKKTSCFSLKYLVWKCPQTKKYPVVSRLQMQTVIQVA